MTYHSRASSTTTFTNPPSRKSKRTSRKTLYQLDNIGINIFCQPLTDSINKIKDFQPLNFMDDMGIFFVCKPLRYLERFAAFILRVQC